MSTVYQVQNNLLRTVSVKLDASRANVLFFDVQEDQARPLDSLIRTRGYSIVQRAPIVPMKIVAINSLEGTRLLTGDSAARGGRRERGALRRGLPTQFLASTSPSSGPKVGVLSPE